MPSTPVLAALLAFLAIAASADVSLTITIDMADVITARYYCGAGGPLAVVYVASEIDGLALVPVEGDTRVFAEA